MSRYEDDMWDKLAAGRGDELSRLNGPDDPASSRPPRGRGGRRGGRGGRRPRPGVAIAGGTVVMAAIVAVVVTLVSASTAPPAWAVSRKSDGSVWVTLRNPAATAALNARLRAMGVRARVVVAGGSCQGRLRVMTLHGDAHVTPMMLTQARERVLVHPALIRPGTTRVIVASASAAGKPVLTQATASGAGPNCIAQLRRVGERMQVVAGARPPILSQAGGPIWCHPVAVALTPVGGRGGAGAATTTSGRPATTAATQTAIDQSGTATTGGSSGTATTSGTATGAGPVAQQGPNWSHGVRGPLARALILARGRGATRAAVICSRPVPGAGTSTGTSTSTSTSRGTSTSSGTSTSRGTGTGTGTGTATTP